MSSVQYPTLPEQNPSETRISYAEYTPLVSDRYYYIYRHNDSFSERLRRALLFMFLTCALSLVFFGLLCAFLQIIETEDDGDTYFLFTKRWPAAECKGSNSRCIRDLDRYNRWLIHGLWPEFTNNTWNQYCSKQKFNASEITSLRSEMLQTWPNLLENQTEDSLWAHEWNKHGTCSKLDQFAYFSHTLTLNSRIRLDEWLQDAGIVPNNTKQYTVSEFKHALSDNISPHSIQLNCEQLQGKNYLKEIYICVAFNDAASFRRCTVETNCETGNGQFIYPALNK